MKLVEKIKNAISLWNLLLRAAVFGLSWLLLPFWLFVIVAAYLYFIPFFDVKKLSLAFLAVIFYATIEPQGILFAIVLSVLFFLILGVKDLVFIQRKSAYEVLVLLLAFLTFIKFFSHFGSGISPEGFFYALVSGAFVFLLLKGLLNYGVDGGIFAAERPCRGGAFAAIAGLAVSEIMIAALFAPLNYLYQSAFVFLATALAVETSSDYLDGKLARRTVLIDTSIFLVFAVIIFGSATWTL